MIKQCTGYKLFCDACGARIGNVFANKGVVQCYAAVMGYTSADLAYHFCSPRCKAKLEKQVAKKKVAKKKGGKNG